MYEPFDAFEYVEYLRRRWRVAAVACGTAIVLALAVSWLIPKRYTATASIVIEPPGGNDVRTATAVSPVYLESLRTYERFAGSDSLFERAAERFHLQKDSQSIESLKQRVLKVSKLRDTKILEISATLPEPKLAQHLVQFLADETVTMSRSENLAGDHELIEEAQKQEINARQRLDREDKAWRENAMREPVEALQQEIEANVELRTKIRQDLAEAQADAAEYRQPDKQSDTEFARHQLQAAQARVAVLAKQAEDLGKDIDQKSATLSRRIAHREQLQTELKMAQAAYESAAAHLRDVRAGAGMRGERLRVIDPGIVPERPSSPDVSLNAIAACFLALLASIVYLSLGFAYRRKTAPFPEVSSRGRRA
ncbi:MAG TPA: hypothetical protein VKV15_08405 [Bryobacteraceae bacterium]|nr:hypothetical protein [Bryobacteraceae bacterium]